MCAGRCASPSSSLWRATHLRVVSRHAMHSARPRPVTVAHRSKPSAATHCSTLWRSPDAASSSGIGRSLSSRCQASFALAMSNTSSGPACAGACAAALHMGARQHHMSAGMQRRKHVQGHTFGQRLQHCQSRPQAHSLPTAQQRRRPWQRQPRQHRRVHCLRCADRGANSRLVTAQVRTGIENARTGFLWAGCASVPGVAACRGDANAGAA